MMLGPERHVLGGARPPRPGGVRPASVPPHRPWSRLLPAPRPRLGPLAVEPGAPLLPAPAPEERDRLRAALDRIDKAPSDDEEPVLSAALTEATTGAETTFATSTGVVKEVAPQDAPVRS